MPIHVDELGSTFRIDVKQAWAGLEMRATWSAQLMEEGNRGRWKRRGKAVINDEGPIAAISDLLSALDMGNLPDLTP